MEELYLFKKPKNNQGYLNNSIFNDTLSGKIFDVTDSVDLDDFLPDIIFDENEFNNVSCLNDISQCLFQDNISSFEKVIYEDEKDKQENLELLQMIQNCFPEKKTNKIYSFFLAKNKDYISNNISNIINMTKTKKSPSRNIKNTSSSNNISKINPKSNSNLSFYEGNLPTQIAKKNKQKLMEDRKNIFMDKSFCHLIDLKEIGEEKKANEFNISKLKVEKRNLLSFNGNDEHYKQDFSNFNQINFSSFLKDDYNKNFNQENNSCILSNFNDYSLYNNTFLSNHQHSFQNKNVYFPYYRDKNKSFIFSNKKRKRNLIENNCSQMNINENVKIKLNTIKNNHKLFIISSLPQNNKYDNGNINNNNYNINDNGNNNNNNYNGYKNNNLGRKKKNSGEEGKHNKNCPDNIIKKIKSITFNIILDGINEKLKGINMSELNNIFYPLKLLRINHTQTQNATKIYNLDLLNKSLKSIFSSKISGRYDKNENYNRDLINKLYTIYQNGNIEERKKIEKIVKFLDIKLQDFFNYLKEYE